MCLCISGKSKRRFSDPVVPTLSYLFYVIRSTERQRDTLKNGDMHSSQQFLTLANDFISQNISPVAL
jgi:hypothetical protein